MKRNTTLKISSALFVLLLASAALQAQNVGIGTAPPQEKLHVAGNVCIDPLAGSGQGVAIANTQGTLQVVPVGATGEILTQQPGGPQWEPLPNSSASSVSNCTTPPCPTQLSLTAVATMNWGTCSRYCENLVEGGFSDWRMPTKEEIIHLFSTTISEPVQIWLNTANHPNSQYWQVIYMGHGGLNDQLANNLMNCKCIR